MVHQHFKLVPSFTVAQNIALGCEPVKTRPFYDFKAAREKVESLVDAFGLTIDPDAPVRELGVGLQQRVEILKTLGRGADILILDEPTAVLTPQETDELFDVIRRIVHEKRMTVIIITHKLYEVMAISDRVGVMRAGKLVGVRDTKDVDERMLASMMVGREMFFAPIERKNETGEALMEVKDLFARSDRGLMTVNGVSFSVRAGEVVGIAAVEGNGQSELVEAITGLRRIERGEAFVCGANVAGKSPGEIRALGLSHIPEDRVKTGVSPKSSVKDNLLVGRQRERRFARWGLQLRTGPIRAYAESLFEKFDIRGAGVDVAAGSLSGGNLQKVVVAREFSFDARALVVDQPTRGVDIGASEFIHKLIVEKRNAGCAILLVSADLDEVFRLSDRIIALYEGKITGEFQAGAIDKAEVGYCMTGGKKEADGR